MTFALNPGRPVSRNLSRIAIGELRLALETARDEEKPGKDRIHGARTHCKNIRGLLRIVGPAFPAYREENTAIRDASAALSRARDHAVMAATLSSLTDKGKFAARETRRLRAAVDLAAEHDAEPGAVLERFVADIEPVSVRARLWHADFLRWDAVVDGAAKTYARARKAMLRAVDSGAPADLHEWRKLVKYHFHQLTLLRRFEPEGFIASRRLAKSLGNLLGAHHDLQVLSDHLSATMLQDPELLARIGELTSRQQARRLAKAAKLGTALFEAGGGEWRRHLAELIFSAVGPSAAMKEAPDGGGN